MKAYTIIAPKKTWDVQWFLQGSFFVATFIKSGQETAPNCPIFLSFKPLGLTRKEL